MSDTNNTVSNPCKVRPIVLTIAGSDSSGLAGIASDLKAQTQFRVHSAMVITANTAQNNQQVLAINAVDQHVLKTQLQAVSNLDISVVKVGLIANLAQVNLIEQFIRDKKIPLVLDPVLSSTSQCEFFSPADISEYVHRLLPLCYLITPNQSEAAKLTQLTIDDSVSVQVAAKKLQQLGAKNVLITGGVPPLDTTSSMQVSPPNCNDLFLSKYHQFWLSSPTINTHNSRGTGCSLASTVCAALAIGYCVEDAVTLAKMAVNQGLRNSYSLSGEKGPLAISDFPQQPIDLPILSPTVPAASAEFRFPDCSLPDGSLTKTKQAKPLGLYPVVDSADWIERLVKVGVTTIQLRIKNLSGKQLEKEIVTGIRIAQHYQVRLFINDYWKLAIKHNAYGVHLGQQDLDDADIRAIQAAGLRLGISTHCHYEVARARYYRPSYIACGPIFHTDSKVMPWIPQGVEGLDYWLALLDYPVVAIGGINQQRFKQLSKTTVDGIAMISAITTAKKPEQVCIDFIKQFEDSRANVKARRC